MPGLVGANEDGRMTTTMTMDDDRDEDGMNESRDLRKQVKKLRSKLQGELKRLELSRLRSLRTRELPELGLRIKMMKGNTTQQKGLQRSEVLRGVLGSHFKALCNRELMIWS